MKEQSILLPIFTVLTCAVFPSFGSAADSSAPQSAANPQYKSLPPPPRNPWAEQRNNGQEQSRNAPWGAFPSPFWQPAPFFGGPSENAEQNAQPRRHQPWSNTYPGQPNMQRRGGGGMGSRRPAPPWGGSFPQNSTGGGSDKQPQMPSGAGMNMPFGAFPAPGMGFPSQMPGQPPGQTPAQSNTQTYDPAPQDAERGNRGFPGGFPSMGMPGFSGMPIPGGGAWPRRNNFSGSGMEPPSYSNSDTSRMPRQERRSAGMGAYPPGGMNFPGYSEREIRSMPEPGMMEYSKEPRMGYPGFIPEPPPFVTERDISGSAFSSDSYGGLPGFPQTPAGNSYSVPGTGFGGGDSMSAPYDRVYPGAESASAYPGSTRGDSSMPAYPGGYGDMPPAHYGAAGENYPAPQAPSYNTAPGAGEPFSSGAGGGRPYFPRSASERMSSAAPAAGFSSTPPAGMGFPGYMPSPRSYPEPGMTPPGAPTASLTTPPILPPSKFDAPIPEYPPLPAAESGKAADSREDGQGKSATK